VSYSVYITKALVCGSSPQGLSDKNFLLYTDKAGMLYASGRSVREEKSKQRNALQDFSRVVVSLVQGKGGWRIGSVEAKGNDFFLATDKEARRSVVRIYKFLRRFIKGEEESVELYTFVEEALNHLRGEVSDRELKVLYVEVKILHQLGYVADGILPEIDIEVLDDSLINKRKMESLINDAIASSHL
jgi:recombinational DNA repair protein (RecF pathway)